MPQVRGSHDRDEREDRQRRVRHQENLVEALSTRGLDMPLMHVHREDGSRILGDGHTSIGRMRLDFPLVTSNITCA